MLMKLTAGWRHCQAQLSHYWDAETNYRMVSGEQQFSASQIKQSFTDKATLPHSFLHTNYDMLEKV